MTESEEVDVESNFDGEVDVGSNFNGDLLPTCGQETESNPGFDFADDLFRIPGENRKKLTKAEKRQQSKERTQEKTKTSSMTLAQHKRLMKMYRSGGKRKVFTECYRRMEFGCENGNQGKTPKNEGEKVAKLHFCFSTCYNLYFCFFLCISALLSFQNQPFLKDFRFTNFRFADLQICRIAELQICELQICRFVELQNCRFRANFTFTICDNCMC